MPTNTKAFDPLAYIEEAFLDNPKHKNKDATGSDAKPKGKRGRPLGSTNGAAAQRKKFRKTEMSAPRPRRASGAAGKETIIDPKLQEVWDGLPKNLEFLFFYYDDSVTANYYRGDFKESREQLLQRILNPELSLEETSRLLGVCPATVRRYTNRGWIAHHRTKGGQRRFRLSDLAKFVQEHGRFPEE